MKFQGRGEETESGACASMAPFLTALFDGEADETSAERARAHLLSCEKCARTWLAWNGHRAALRNDSVPAPPPALLWRVLLACRLAGSNQRARQLETGAPADLQTRILARTTAAATRSNSPSQPKIRWNYAPALAAPALAAWLLLLNFQPSRDVRSNRSSTTQSATIRSSTNESPGPRRFVDERDSRVVTRIPLETAATPVESPRAARRVISRRVRGVAAVSRPLPARDVVQNLPRRAFSTRLILAQFVPTRRRAASFRVTRDAPRAISRSQRSDSIPADAPVEMPQRARIEESQGFQLASVSSTKESAPISSAPRVQTPRNASFSDSVETPRVRLTRPRLRFALASSRARITPDEDAALRVSQPHASGIQVATFVDEREEAPEQVEDLRSVVDDFRAVLAEDSFE